MYKSKSGKQAVLFNATKGATITGDGTTPLAVNSWFYVVKTAGTSTLPVDAGYVFKSPDLANQITPAVGDDVQLITLTKVCKVDASFSAETGTIDTTDDCSDGYNQMITDGFTTISGSAGGFIKFNETDDSLVITQKDYLNRFFTVVEDDGEGVYTITGKDDSDVLLFILKNSDSTATGRKQVWLIVPAILTSNTLDNPLKGVQNFDFAWTKGEGGATAYIRTTNATETVF